MQGAIEEERYAIPRLWHSPQDAILSGKQIELHTCTKCHYVEIVEIENIDATEGKGKKNTTQNPKYQTAMTQRWPAQARHR
jgi:hypothetical protein